MDSGSGNINYLNKFKVEDTVGKLVEWEVGEEIEVKGCRFKVKEIKVFPKNEIVLVGMSVKSEIDKLMEEIPKETFEENQHRIMNFVRHL